MMNPQDPNYNTGQTPLVQPQTFAPPESQPQQPQAQGTQPQVQPYAGQPVYSQTTQPGTQPIETQYAQSQAAPNQSVAGSPSPYSFITSPDVPQKSFQGGSMTKRILIFLAGLAVLGIIAVIVITLLTPKDPMIEGLTSIAMKQQEVTRVSGLVYQGATSHDLKNLAVNTQLAVSTDQADVKKYLAERNAPVNEKTLPQSANATTTSTLTSAKSTNTFNQAAYDALVKELEDYSKAIVAAHKDASDSPKAKQLLEKQFNNTKLLIEQASAVVL